MGGISHTKKLTQSINKNLKLIFMALLSMSSITILCGVWYGVMFYDFHKCLKILMFGYKSH